MSAKKEKIKIENVAEKLNKFMQAKNREDAIDAGFYDGRFGTRSEKDKKKSEYLKLRKNKHFYKNL